MVTYEPYPVIPLTDLHEELRFEYPDLPDQLFDYYNMRTAVDMAQRGNLLKRVVNIELEPNVTRYVLRSPDGLKLWSIMSAHIDGCCGTSKVRRFMSRPDTLHCWFGKDVWWNDTEQTLHVETCGGGVLRVVIAVVPDRDACELPRVYKDKYLETLLMGTRAAMMLITGRPWTNLRLGGQMRAEYINMVAALSVENATHGQRGTVKINFGRAL